MDFIPEHEAVRDLIFKHREQVTTQANKDKQRQELEAVLAAEFGGTPAPNEQKSAPDTARTSRERPGVLATRFINAQGEIVYRKHWLFWMRKVFIGGLLTVVALALVMAGLIAPSFADTRPIVVLGAFALLLVGAAWAYFGDWDWRHDLYIIGNSAITLIRKRPLFIQDEDDRLLLERVDNILTERSGLFRKLFNYGDVKVMLVGDDKPHVFKNVPNPQVVREEISQRQKRHTQREKEQDQRRQREEVVEAIRLYHDKYGAPPAAPQQQEQQGGLYRRPINFPRVRGGGRS
jgi:hypothetical protein